MLCDYAVKEGLNLLYSPQGIQEVGLHMTWYFQAL